MYKKSRLSRIYDHMYQRCYNPNCKDYKDYGGRGITICDEWLDNTIISVRYSRYKKGKLIFKEWALSNGYADDLTIDRIDVNKEYFPNNCRFVDEKTQANNKRTNKYLSYKGKTQTLAQWCNELGLDYEKTKARLNACHWSVEKAFETGIDPKLRMITLNGKTQSLSAWCRERKLSLGTVSDRLYTRHWSVDKALESKDFRKED